jgi:sigma-B regulation protein RsbU (phosphoserine phosphatase)
MVLGLNFDRGEAFERLLKEVTLPLCTGDLFFFFTDGISEAMDRDGNCFGESRLSSMLEKYADQPADEIRNLVFQEVAAFVGGQPQHDDITMIVLKAA